MAQRWGVLPTELLEDDVALCVNSTIFFASEDFYEANRPKVPGEIPAPLSAEEVRVQRLRQGGAFEEMEAKLKAVGAR